MAKKESEKYYKKACKKLSKEFNFSEKRFLNEGTYHSTASIVGIVEIDSLHYGNSYLYISDCSRTISLVMDIQNKKDRKNSIFKLKQIIETCSNMVTSLEALKEMEIKRKKYEKKYKELQQKESEANKKED